MEISKYRNQVIQLYSDTITNYFQYTTKHSGDANLHNDRAIYNGWNVIIQILSMLYLIQMNVEQMEVYLDRSYALFNEYSKTIYTSDFNEMHTPIMFVHKVLIGNIALNAYEPSKKLLHSDDHDIYTLKICKWSGLILAWGNKTLSFLERQRSHSQFTHQLLSIVLDERVYHTYRLIEILQQTVDPAVYSSRHVLLFNALHRFYTKNKRSYSPDEIQTIAFNVFFRNIDVLNLLFSESNTSQHMDEFVIWLFGGGVNKAQLTHDTF